MNFSRTYLCWAFLIILAGAAVAFFWYDPDRNLIDEHYLTTDEYRSFQSDYADIRHRSVDEDRLIELLAVKALQTYPVRELSDTLRIDSTAINPRLAPAQQLKIAVKEIRVPDKYRAFRFYHLLNYMAAGDTTVMLIARHPSMYREWELLLATVSDSLQLRDWLPIAVYRTNLQEQVDSRVVIEPGGIITTYVQKHQRYPIEQRNRYVDQYRIDSLGHIQPLHGTSQ